MEVKVCGMRSLLCSSAAGCETEETNYELNVVIHVCPDVDGIEAGKRQLKLRLPTGSSLANVLYNVSLSLLAFRVCGACMPMVHRESTPRILADACGRPGMFC